MGETNDLRSRLQGLRLYGDRFRRQGFVGGPFHFVAQTATAEVHQGVTAYAVCERVQDRMHCFVHRVYMVEGMLVYEDPIANAMRIAVTSVETPDVALLDELERVELMDYLLQIGQKIPPYEYFGILFREPELRGQCFLTITNSEHVWHPRAGMSAALNEILRRILDGEPPDLFLGDADEMRARGLFVDVPSDSGAQGFERHSAMLVPELPSKARCIYESVHRESGAAFQWLLHPSGRMEFSVTDSFARVLFAVTKGPIPVRRPFCFGSTMFRTTRGTVITLYLDGRVVGRQSFPERFDFAAELTDFEIWQNTSRVAEANDKLGVRKMIEFTEPLAPKQRRELFTTMSGDMGRAEANYLWFTPGSHGHIPKQERNMKLIGGVLPLPLSEIASAVDSDAQD